MKVLLYKVGRNLNRAYRTCEAFGVAELLLKDCPQANLKDNLFAAKGRVAITSVDDWGDSLLLLETNYHLPLWRIDWRQINCVVIGGETSGLPRQIPGHHQRATIPIWGKISGLTVEAALGIALYEWKRHEHL